MRAAAVRPTFEIELEAEPEAVINGLKDDLDGINCPFEARWAGQHLLFTVCEQERHFWSPWLHIDVLPEDTGSRIRARFSPHPNIWTMYALSYLALVSAALFGACFAGAQFLLHQSPWAVWVVVASALIGLAMWISALIGQRLAHEQMGTLKQQFEALIARRSGKSSPSGSGPE
ncbi:MAG TPA: hypothetical protein ENJ00_05155 [Phycisphaerales bacterium]|nr:hypothetical protein [Phycisphaerales bacterium]